MKKQLLFTLLVFFSCFLHAQTYEISFSGSGSSTTVDSVLVQNLNQGTSLKMAGSDILVLDLIVGEDEVPVSSNGLFIFPNPSSSTCYVEFEATGSSQTTAEVLGIDGKIVAQEDYALIDGTHRFRIENLKQGIYFVRFFSQDFHYCGKIISLFEGNEVPVIKHEFVMNRKKTLLSLTSGLNDSERQTIMLSTFVHMAYSSGERLLLKGISGNYSTIVSIIPDHSQVLDFLFVPCADADGNHYPVVHIGNQTWMAENLKTTNFRNGDAIPQIIGMTEWSGLDSAAYCNYNNSEDSVKTYGRLYNGHAAKDERKVAPAGWRVPTLTDFSNLTTFCGGSLITGGKIKETGYNHWLAPNTGFSNETGFTALPTGSRVPSGTFSSCGTYAPFWSATRDIYSSEMTMYFWLSFINAELRTASLYNNAGHAIRCILGELPEISLDSITDVSSFSGSVYGQVVSEGTVPVTERGFCWIIGNGPDAIPTVANGNIVCGSGSGSFSYNIEGLVPSTDYRVRAYATNAFGTTYSEILNFHTEYDLPYIQNVPVSNIGSYSATSGGEIDVVAGFVSDMHGVCWCEWPNTPYVYDAHTEDGSGTGSYVSQITGLQPGKTYNVRAYSTNATGTVYSIEYETFTAIPILPTITTATISGLTVPTAVSGGNVTYDGGSPILERGVCWCTTNCIPTIANDHTSDGAGLGSFVSNIPTGNLMHYHIRAYARNSVGVAYGEVIELDAVVQLGQFYQGGIIGCLFNNNANGLIVSQNYYQAEWGCYGGHVTTSYDFGSGPANTQAIVNACSTPNIAARICYDLVLNGYDDWFLPSKNELGSLYPNKDIINGFFPLGYWSSSQCNEYPCSSNDAYGLNFGDGIFGGGAKYFVMYFRPVRAF